MRTRSARGRTSAASPGRRGFSMVEMVTATALLLVAMTLTAHLIGWVAAERRAAERRSRAIREAANLMERLTAAAPAELTPERVAALRLSPPALRSLPGGAVSVGVADAEAGLKRIHVEVRWRNRAGEGEAPVRLTSWVAPPRRARP